MGSNLTTFAGIDFVIQLAGFVFSSALHTEKFYDLTGSLTFLLLARLSLHLGLGSFRQRVQTNLITAWALRLGCFLFYRVLREGQDRRFDKVKTNPKIFFMYWMVQGIWVFLTLFPSLLNNDNREAKRVTTRDYVGWGMWVIGFLIECVADWQKLQFKMDPDNAGKFISSGLWSISRHPNYFGEILLWVGLFISSSTNLKGWKWISILCPVFNYYLLTQVSGIPILEKSGLRRFGHLPEYQQYIKTVPSLIPFFGSP